MTRNNNEYIALSEDSCYHNHVIEVTTVDTGSVNSCVRRIPLKHLSLKLLSETVVSRRKTMKLSQAALSEKANIHRSMLSRLELADYSPSVDQLLSLCAVLGFKPSDVIVDDEAEPIEVERKRIAVAGTGYVGLSIAVLLSQHNEVTAVDIIPEKVEKINNWKSPIQDEYIERYVAEHEERGLSLHATTVAASLCRCRFHHYRGSDKLRSEDELL